MKLIQEQTYVLKELMNSLIKEVFSSTNEKKRKKKRQNLKKAGQIISRVFKKQINVQMKTRPEHKEKKKKKRKKRKIKKTPDYFPKDAIREVSYFVNYPTIGKVMKTSKWFNGALTDPESVLFWENKFKIEFLFEYPLYLKQVDWRQRTKLFLDEIKRIEREKDYDNEKTFLKGNEAILFHFVNRFNVYHTGPYFRVNKKLNDKFLMEVIKLNINFFNEIYSKTNDSHIYDRKKIFITYLNEINSIQKEFKKYNKEEDPQNYYDRLKELEDEKDDLNDFIEIFMTDLNNSKYKGLLKDKDVVPKLVEIDGLLLEYVDKDLRCNEDIILAAVKNNGMALEFAIWANLKKRSIVLEAIKNRRDAIKFAPEFISPGTEDKEIIDLVLETYNGAREAMEINGLLLKDVTPAFKDANLVYRAVHQNGLALEYGDPWKDNDIIVDIAIRKNPKAIQHASTRLQKIFKKKKYLKL